MSLQQIEELMVFVSQRIPIFIQKNGVIDSFNLDLGEPERAYAAFDLA